MYIIEYLEMFKYNSENMAADEKDCFIQYLVDKVNMFELHKRATELAVEMPARTRRGMMPPTVRTRRTSFAYHSVISTVKLHGMSCWDYLGKFFKKIFNGCRDFLSLTPSNIGLSSI